MAGRGCDGWTVRGPHPRSPWRTFARKGPHTSRWSWQPPSAAVQAPTRDGARGGGGGGGGSAALRYLGLPVRWLAWWGRWMSESVAAHYGDAPNDFVVADNVELPWPGAQGDMEWEWRVVSLRGSLKRSARVVQLFGRLAVLETHTLRY